MMTLGVFWRAGERAWKLFSRRDQQFDLEMGDHPPSDALDAGVGEPEGHRVEHFQFFLNFRRLK